MRPLFLCCALLAALTAAAAPAAAEAARGTIYISSLPSRADIWIDGTFVGESPIVIAAVAEGHHVISVSKAGYAVQDVGIDVAGGGDPLMESIRLAPMATPLRQTGTLAIRSDLAGGAVYVDGSEAGKVPVSARAVAAGRHYVELRYPGGSVARDVEVFPDTETVVVLHAKSTSGPVVIAPIDTYIPDDAYTLVGGKLVIRYAGHKVVGHLDHLDYAVDDKPRRYDAAPTLVAGRLYLPLALLQWLDAGGKK
ncbi:MAG TPA: PEGA domain-containing protein [Candidatus Dormibacteraeota bacterium]|nr:PEGA domain-containing protein [Candidatus Dormibacteraeota bacterium]